MIGARGALQFSVALALLLSGAGCAVNATRASTPANQGASPTAHSQEVSARDVQQVVMEMADDHIAALGEAVYLTADKVKEDRRARKLAQSFLRNGVGAAMDIATHSNPDVSLLDMVVLASLQRWAFEEHWIPAGIGEEAGALALARLEEAEASAWHSAGQVLSAAQIDELRVLIDNWVAENADQTVVSFVRFDEFLDERSVAEAETRGRASKLLREWRATVTAVEDAILFGERAIWFAGRYPYILGEQAELTAYRLADQPEFRRIEEALGTLDALAGTVASLEQRVPERPVDDAEAAMTRVAERTLRQAFEGLATERRALLDELATRQGELSPFLEELGRSVEASSSLASRLTETLGRADGLLARFQQTGPSGEPPLDLALVRQTVVDAGASADALARLLEQTNATLDSPAWDRRLAEIQGLREDAIDQAFWRGLILVIVFLAGLFVVLRYSRATSRTHQGS